jgi:hypothetical protein
MSLRKIEWDYPDGSFATESMNPLFLAKVDDAPSRLADIEGLSS